MNKRNAGKYYWNRNYSFCFQFSTLFNFIEFSLTFGFTTIALFVRERYLFIDVLINTGKLLSNPGQQKSLNPEV